MSRDQIFKKYPHDTNKAEVPMHSHFNGQLEYVSSGTMRLITPNAAWVVPQQRIIWIPPGQPHSVRCNNLSGSWKIMAPGSYSKFLPKTVSVLHTSKLLAAALESVPENKKSISAQKLRLLIEIIKFELRTAASESFAVTLPKSAQLSPLIQRLLDHPEDPRRIDEWAEEVGMSRRTFTRKFMDETGSTFGQWRTALLLGKALDLLSEGHSVSEISDRLGYSGPSAFVAGFKMRFGVSPGKFFEANRR